MTLAADTPVEGSVELTRVGVVRRPRIELRALVPQRKRAGWRVVHVALGRATTAAGDAAVDE
jgi:hypothetical protein